MTALVRVAWGSAHPCTGVRWYKAGWSAHRATLAAALRTDSSSNRDNGGTTPTLTLTRVTDDVAKAQGDASGSDKMGGDHFIATFQSQFLMDWRSEGGQERSREWLDGFCRQLWLSWAEWSCLRQCSLFRPQGTIKPWVTTWARAGGSRAGDMPFFPTEWLPGRDRWVSTHLGIISLLREPQTKGVHHSTNSGFREEASRARRRKPLSQSGRSIFKVFPWTPIGRSWQRHRGRPRPGTLRVKARGPGIHGRAEVSEGGGGVDCRPLCTGCTPSLCRGGFPQESCHGNYPGWGPKGHT